MTPKEENIIQLLASQNKEWEFLDVQLFDAINDLLALEGLPPLRPDIVECLECERPFLSWDRTMNRVCDRCAAAHTSGRDPMLEECPVHHPHWKPEAAAGLNRFDMRIGLLPPPEATIFKEAFFSRGADDDYFWRLREGKSIFDPSDYVV